MLGQTVCYLADVGASLGRHVVDVTGNIMCTLIKEMGNIMCTLIKEIGIGHIVCTFTKEIGSTLRCSVDKGVELFKSRPEIVRECIKFPLSVII